MGGDVKKNSVATAKKAATSVPGPTPRAAGAKHRSYGSKFIQDSDFFHTRIVVEKRYYIINYPSNIEHPHLGCV